MRLCGLQQRCSNRVANDITHMTVQSQLTRVERQRIALTHAQRSRIDGQVKRLE